MCQGFKLPSLTASKTALINSHVLAVTFWVQPTFWEQITLDAVAPIVAAVFGGIAVNFVVRLAQRRRERQQLRSSLSLDMMRIAYGFYRPLIEVIRRELHGVKISSSHRPVIPGRLSGIPLSMAHPSARVPGFRGAGACMCDY